MINKPERAGRAIILPSRSSQPFLYVKKIRIQSPLDGLPLHVKQSIAAWLTTGGQHGQGITYKVARAKLLSEFGVKTSVTALCNFFQRHSKAKPAPVLVVTGLAANAQPSDASGVRIETFHIRDGDTLTVTLNISLPQPAASRPKIIVLPHQPFTP